jgi:Pyruvate/2-oxoacid:ferredoxin oxidoreductase delta subunit
MGGLWAGSGPVDPAEVLLPEVTAARCVHSQMEQASCRACLDACPTRAWVMDDERLGIDATLCDGCGLCAPACPEGAILSPFAPVRYRVEGAGIAFAACARAGIAGPIEGVLPCLHALGVRTLLDLTCKGVRRLVLSRGNCGTCPRGADLPAERQLDQRLEGIAALLRDRGLTPLEAANLSPPRWEEEHRAARARHLSPAIGRRAFFKGVFDAAVDAGLERAERNDPRVATFVPPGRMIPRPESSRFALHAPEIDGERCTGCDACARLCPHDVFAVEPDAYRTDADGCTGCGLCADVCTQAAVVARAQVASPQTRLPLFPRRCPACGVPYHSPQRVSDARGLCPVCAVTNHHRRLYQVIGQA